MSGWYKANISLWRLESLSMQGLVLGFRLQSVQGCRCTHGWGCSLQHSMLVTG